jgi:hypothetical protein
MAIFTPIFQLAKKIRIPFAKHKNMTKLIFVFAILIVALSIINAETYTLIVDTTASYQITGKECLPTPTTTNGISKAYIGGKSAFITFVTPAALTDDAVAYFKGKFPTCVTALGQDASFKAVTLPTEDSKLNECLASSSCGVNNSCTCHEGQKCKDVGNSGCGLGLFCKELKNAAQDWVCSPSGSTFVFYDVTNTNIQTDLEKLNSQYICDDAFFDVKTYGNIVVVSASEVDGDDSSPIPLTSNCINGIQSTVGEGLKFKVSHFDDQTPVDNAEGIKQCAVKCGGSDICPCYGEEGQCFSSTDLCFNNDGYFCDSNAAWQGKCTRINQMYHIIGLLKEEWKFEDFLRDFKESAFYKTCTDRAKSVVSTGNWREVSIYYSGHALAACDIEKLAEVKAMTHYFDIEDLVITPIDEELAAACTTSNGDVLCASSGSQCEQFLCSVNEKCSANAQCASNKCHKKKLFCEVNPDKSSTTVFSYAVAIIVVVAATLF